MKKKLVWLTIALLFTSVVLASFFYSPIVNCLVQKTPGQPVDTLNGVVIYYNGAVNHTAGRNTSPDGYNIGLKWQCVEFVKRYYFEFLHHKMPDSYGHAKDFYNKKIMDGALNSARDLVQFSNGSSSSPLPNDLLVFDGHTFNPYGHVAIVSQVLPDKIQIAQQNPGPTGSSRVWIGLKKDGGKWYVNDDLVLGWLRKKQ